VPCGSPYVCPLAGGRCVHAPAEEGELCDLDGLGGAACGPGLTCQAGIPQICVLKKSIGEACFSTTNCLDGLECWPFYQQCFPEGGERLFDDEQCRSWYRPSVHQDAMNADLALSFGYGSATSVLVGGSYEIGIVYGPDGSYGCYLSTCSGIKSDVEIGSFACVGFHSSYESFRGESLVFVEEVGEGVAFSTSQSFSFDDPPVLVGTSDCLSIELSLAPIAAGEYFCNTIVDTLIPDEGSCGDGTVDENEDCDDGTATFAPGDECTERCLFARCGSPTGVIGMRPSATDALIIVRSAVQSQTCAASVCDANGDGSIAATDALAVLAAAVGRPVALSCPPPAG
jgi:cysteine-rich repeat protein